MFRSQNMFKLRNYLVILTIITIFSTTALPLLAQPDQKDLPKKLRTSPIPWETNLGVKDFGIFSDLDSRVQLFLPPSNQAEYKITKSRKGQTSLVLFQDGWPTKVYPWKGKLDQAALRGELRPGDHNELLQHLRNNKTAITNKIWDDLDSDGIPDPLDLLIGAKKTVLNGAHYGGGYRRITFPGGDIARKDGVCTDVVVRAVRNIGLDIQSELQKDIRKRPKAFPMVKKANANIDHRRVKTLLPYFQKHWDLRDKSLHNKTDPYRPGDIVFMDTFPQRKGPDHIGIVSNTRGAQGHLLVINNWTDGFSTSEMDLLGNIPVTHRFRIKPAQDSHSTK